MILVDRETVLRAGPNAVAIHKHGENVIVGQAVDGGVILKMVARHLGRRGVRQQRGSQKRSDCDYLFHRVLKYSIRSFNSSLVRSLVRPCLSSGLKTVQISSSVRADPSCRYGAVMAMLVNCGVSSRPVLSVVLRVPTSNDF